MEKQSERTNRHHYWESLVKEQEESGLSQVEFCRQRQLVQSQFGYYRGLVKASKTEKMIEDFSPIKFKASETLLTAEIKILLPNGFQCIFPPHMQIKQVKQLMEVLLSC